MIEIILKEFLKQKLTNVPVWLEIPANPPSAFLLIEHTGGGDLGKTLYSAMMAVQSYGPTMADAAALNERVKKAMRSLSELPKICQCRLNADYNFTDTASKRYRYQAVFDITHYREE